MTNTVTIYSTDELEKHKTTILSNLAKSVWDIRAIIESDNAQEVFRQFKFEKIATEPLSGKPENLVEVINQSQTYFVTLAATEYLLHLYPAKAFTLNWGNVSGYDIESTGGYGLGMSIAQSIVAVHKGKIRAECPGENVLMISVTLPL